jgi:crotonobetainyl-CoA:carnitine CoA-transferase CaiB-like acyl-CoA transferase
MSPLEGIRVLDLSRVLAGPYCTMLLADLGADVVKVERPGEGDETRHWGPPYVGGEAAYFLSVNAGKRSVAVDLSHPDGRATAQRLASSADVLIENFRAGTADRLGLGYDELARDNARLVYCSIGGFGRGRAPAGRPGYDFVVQAESGLMSITGEREGRPLKVGVAVVDVLSGYAAATAILGALVARGQSGRGARVEISLLDTALSALVNVAAGALATGEEPARFGNAHPNIVPYQTFDAADAPIAVAAANDGLFRRLCAAIDRPELADDERYATNPQRVVNRIELVEELERVFTMRTADEWSDRLSEAGVPAGKVRTVLDALETATLAGVPAISEVEHASAGPLPLVASPLRNAGGHPARTPPPLLGEHTRQVLAELGMDENAIDELVASGAVA